MHKERAGGKMYSNDNWSIIPTVSINGIEFGTDRSIVRKILGKPERTFRKSPTSDNTSDAYSNYHVYYSADNKLKAIEFFGSEISLSINSHTIFPGNLSTARVLLTDLQDSNGSYISKSASIGIYAEEDSIISILIGCKNYYD